MLNALLADAAVVISIALGDDESERRNPCWEIGQE